MDESPITGSSMEIPNVSHIEVQPQPRRYRTGISEVEKKALREWFRNQPTKPKQSACVLWFERTYAKRIDRGTVSRILSKRFDHLDEGPVSSAVRKDSPKHPLLEKELSEWLQQRQEAGQTVSGDWIIAKAREIWPRINEENEAMPLFSSGWLTRFKKRFASRMADGTQVELPTAPPKNRNSFKGCVHSVVNLRRTTFTVWMKLVYCGEKPHSMRSRARARHHFIKNAPDSV